jgi:NhaP-type Na+/H+ or K+/H+ antiporter
MLEVTSAAAPIVAAASASSIVTIVVLAIVASWTADRLRIPSIVVLLATGVVIGPVLGLIDPNELLGDLLTPLVALGVGIILFEGGLDLRLRELDDHPRVVWLLVSVGVAVTWVAGAASAVAFLDMKPGIAVVLGAILVVSGPTVIAPILRTIRPERSVASILKWESVAIDPIGAGIAVIAFEFVLADVSQTAGWVVGEVALFVCVGLVAGGLMAVPVAWLIERHLVTEQLVPLVGIAGALVAFAVADSISAESGLLATTVLGFILANRSSLRSEPIARFSKVVQTLLVGVLFIVLSARLSRDQLDSIPVETLALVLVLVLVARPVAVALATWRSDLSVRQRALIAAMAPRGIVAAAVASIFGLELEAAGVAGAEQLAPVAFAVVVATVLLYGLAAGPLARRLDLADKARSGVLIAGAGPVELEIARSLEALGVHVVLASSNRHNERKARLAGHATYYGSLAAHEEVPDEIDMAGIGSLLAMTDNDSTNSLIARNHLAGFGAANTFQIAPDPSDSHEAREDAVAPGGRILFDATMTYERFAETIADGNEIRQTTLSDVFTSAQMRDRLGNDGCILFVKSGDTLDVVADDDRGDVLDRITSGDTVVWIAPVGDLAGASSTTESAT